MERAIEATRRLVATNTNLGMVLLLAPLAAVPDGMTFARACEAVLDATTIDDARAVYRAIRLAQPGGMGSVPDQDVAQEPTLPLKAVMALAADRDLVARQYANGFREVFDDALAALEESLRLGRSIETSIVAAHLTVLSRHPDSLIVRKAGIERRRRSRARRRGPRRRLAGSRGGGRGCVREFDDWLRDPARGSTPAPRPTWSRPPCTRRCEMGQFHYHSPRIRPVDRETPAFLPSIEGVSGVIEDKDTPAMPSPRFTGPRHQGLSRLLLGSLHHLSGRPVRADPRP